MGTPWFTFSRNAATPDVAELSIYAPIGGFDWATGEAGTTAAAFRDALSNVTAKILNIRIHSPGGSVADGLDIYDQLRAHPAQKNVRIGGIAASIASVIAMAGDSISMAQAGNMMIHNASGFVAGDAKYVANYASALEKDNARIRSIYAERTGRKPEDFASLMDAETWFTADEALSWGLIDSIDTYEAAPVAGRIAACLRRYRNVPSTIKNNAAPVVTTPPPAPAPQAAMGVCKLPDGTESEMDEAQCSAAGGEWMPPAEAVQPAPAAPAVQQAKKPATLAQLKAIAGTTAEFREQCIERGASIEEAKDLWIDRLQAKNETLAAQGKQPAGVSNAVQVAPRVTSGNPITDELRAEWDANAENIQSEYGQFERFAAWRRANAQGRVGTRS